MNIKDLPQGSYTPVQSGGLNINNLPQGSYSAVSQQPVALPQSLSDQIWNGISAAGNAITSVLPGRQLGQAIGTDINAGIQSFKQGSLDPIRQANKENAGNFGKVVGDVTKAVTLPTSIGLAAPASLAGAVGQYAGLGAAQSAGESLSQGNGLGQTAKDATVGGLVGGATGGAFNLLGKGINALASKTAPSALSFTSGVPKNAITQTLENPSVAKEGLGMSVGEVRDKAITALQGLHNDLNAEFKQGASLLGDTPLPNAENISNNLIQKVQGVAQQFKLPVTPGEGGLAADFSKSAIVKAGEQNVVNNVLQTVSTWDDFSEKGLQALNQRVNAFKNFEEGGVTKSSAIVGKIHDAIGSAIQENSPGLHALNSNYASNKRVLDEIGNVLSANKDKPTQIQGAVSRLDNLFKDNKDEYVNAIRQLGQKSGVDFLSLLAGGEFQKVLPGFVRGLGGGGAVGVGASVLNPYLLLLAPLFSPRAVGSIVRNAPAAATAASQLTRAATTQAIPAASKGLESLVK